eukprot:GFUD01077792.1.p1 GENE.GFUD01077792.1~~GFUD01077792.1.p1  ORF type:complete len:144 (+),score=68.20 GFUD01077792.1:49-480(+)
MPLSSKLSQRLAMMEKKNNNPEREAKDKEFYEMMKDIDMQSAKRMHSIKSKKRELRGAQRQTKKKVEKLKEERSHEYSTSEDTRQLINRTFAELELSGKAHTFDEWCNECGCIHLEEVLKDSTNVDAPGVVDKDATNNVQKQL